MQTVLDASAVLALILEESGQLEVVSAISAGAMLCAVNAAEIAQRCVTSGMGPADARSLVTQLPVEFVAADLELSLRAATLITQTKPFGLSLGDRYCLALAASRRAPAVTADRDWAKLQKVVGVEVRLIR